MSYCAIIKFENGLPAEQIEFSNSWGGAARIWGSLFDNYLKDARVPYDNWLSLENPRKLWALAKREDLRRFERAVHAFTFDLAYIRREHFLDFGQDLRKFQAFYPVDGRADHLGAWAAIIQRLECQAVGTHGTSVAGNPWKPFDADKDETTFIPLSQGFEVYDWLNCPESV